MPRIKTSGPAVGDHQITIVDTSHDDALQTPRTEPRSFDILRHVRKKARKSQSDDEHTVAIDVLYENQRGAFLCGIPLFSPLTLLNFDPPAWMNGLGQFSPVDVHSAQVPDPTWEWVWDRWHVDMSGDVDQDGWEYNFVFHNNSASWHGTKVWFHAFVRRRRWLRKRKRRSSGERHDPNHNPVEDYFTIYSTTNRNSISFDDGPASRTSIVDDAIPDYATLHRVMRRARLDREKVDALGKFIDEGGDEVQLLGGHVSLCREGANRRSTIFYVSCAFKNHGEKCFSCSRINLPRCGRSRLAR